jgi:hypothetical protein
LRSGNGDWIGIHSSSFGIGSNVINLHDGVGPSRSNGSGQSLRFSSKEVSSDGHIDEEEEGLIEGLSDVVVRVLTSSRVPASGQTSSVSDLSVDQPLHSVLFPDESKGVESVRKVGVKVHGSTSDVSIVGPRSSVMESVGYLFGSLSSIFHDVDFTTGSPSSVDIISGKHPECRPQEVSFGEFGTDFESSVLPSGFESGVHSSRGVLLASLVFDSGVDVQESILDVNVVATRGVALKLVVLGFTVVFKLPLGSVH